MPHTNLNFDFTKTKEFLAKKAKPRSAHKATAKQQLLNSQGPTKGSVRRRLYAPTPIELSQTLQELFFMLKHKPSYTSEEIHYMCARVKQVNSQPLQNLRSKIGELKEEVKDRKENIKTMEKTISTLEEKADSLVGTKDSNALQAVRKWEVLTSILEVAAKYAWTFVPTKDRQRLKHHGINEFLGVFHARYSPGNTGDLAREVYKALHWEIRYFLETVAGDKKIAAARLGEVAYPTITKEDYREALDDCRKECFPDSTSRAVIDLFDYLQVYYRLKA